ncbi:TPA: DNA-binding protein [Candidatus Poribacteria bacterium]|nr:DNA-binding protein [Candidatus Poribacteria bacterium]
MDSLFFSLKKEQNITKLLDLDDVEFSSKPKPISQSSDNNISYMTVAEVADYLNVSKANVLHQIKNRKIRASKIKNQWQIESADIEYQPRQMDLIDTDIDESDNIDNSRQLLLPVNRKKYPRDEGYWRAIFEYYESQRKK